MTEEHMDVCPSCGVKWIDHLGIQGTCAELQRVKGELAEAYTRIFHLVEKGYDYTCESCGNGIYQEICSDNDIWERIKPCGKGIGQGMLCGNCMMDKVTQLLRQAESRAALAPSSGKPEKGGGKKP